MRAALEFVSLALLETEAILFLEHKPFGAHVKSVDIVSPFRFDRPFEAYLMMYFVTTLWMLRSYQPKKHALLDFRTRCQMSSTTRGRSIILGGGMTGLAAASATGYPIYEAKDRPGGTLFVLLHGSA